MCVCDCKDTAALLGKQIAKMPAVVVCFIVACFDFCSEGLMVEGDVIIMFAHLFGK